MGVASTNTIAYKLVASGSILDLFEDEDILLSDNITGLFDIGTLPSDFSRTIVLPATKKNNAFFEHVYDISVDSPYLFSTNVKVEAYLDFDGIYLASGYLQLNKVLVREGLGIESYEVSIFGSLSSFSRDLGKYYLNDLSTLSVYNHTSSYNSITASWSGSLFDGDIVYPLADYGSGYQYTQGSLQTFGINDFDGALGVQNFKPAIRLKKVFDACFEEFGYSYSSSFLQKYDDIPSTYNVTNNGSGNYVIGGSSNPTLTLVKGRTYTFNINAVGHPFWIKTNISTGTSNAYNVGVTNNGTANGTITFKVARNAPSTLYYNCQFHASMAGQINIVDNFIDDIYMVCNTALKYPEYSGVDLETFGKIKVGAISGSGGTNVVLTSGSFITLPWANKFSDPSNVYNNGAYTLPKTSNLEGVLNLNINVSCSINNMPGTFSQNGTWQLRMIETGSSTPYGLTALQSYIVFFDELQQSRTGAINQTYELQTQFKLYGIPAGTYYFQIRQSPDSSTPPLPIVTMDPTNTTKSYLEIRQVNQAADGRVIDIPSNMPYGTNGIRLIDFVKGVQKKFNLVIYPDKTKLNQFIIEPFNEWYNRGEIKDFNRFMNLKTPIEVIPANNLAVNQLEFGDTLDQDYISQQFSKAANRPFGQTFYTDTQNYFSQGKFEVRTSFASSPLLQIAGTGLSGSVAGLNPDPNASYYNQVSSTQYANSGDACLHSGGYFTYYSAEQSTPTIVKLFTDYGRTTPFNGGYQWYKIIDNTFTSYAIFVDYDGTILSFVAC